MNRRARAGAGIVLGFAAAALLSRVWTPWDVAAIDVGQRLLGSTPSHPLGTDQLGRDLLSLLMAGAAPALGTAALATAIGIGMGVPLGLVAAQAGGWRDEVVSRAADILFAFPAIVLALLLVAVLGPGAPQAALAIGLFNIPVFLRVTRAAARATLSRGFVMAARLAGRREAGIAAGHIVPNIAPALLVQASIQLALALLAEAGLSFLGLGAQPPQPSWGRMVAEGQTLVGIAPRLVLLPGLCIVATAIGFTLLADGLREGRGE